MQKEHKVSLRLITSYLLIILYLIPGNAIVISVGNGITIRPSEALSILISIYMIVCKRVHYLKIEKQIMIWLLIATVSAILAFFLFNYTISGFVSGLFYSVRLVALILSSKFVIVSFARRKNPTELLLSIILNCYLFVCFIGFFQLIFFPVAYDWYRLFWNIGMARLNVDPHINRLISTYYDPNYLSSCLLIPFSICLFKWQEGDKRKFIYLVIYTITIVLTVSRSGLLGMAIIIMIFFLRRSKRKREIIRNILLSIIIIIAGIYMFSSNVAIIRRLFNSSKDQSTFDRFASWKYTINIFKYSPVFGIGYNMFDAFCNSVFGKIGDKSDSSLILILISSGIIGSSYFIYALGGLFRKIIHHDINAEKYAMVSILVSALVISNFNNLLFLTSWLFPMLITINIFIGHQWKAR